MVWNEIGSLIDLGSGFHIEVIPSGFALHQVIERGCISIHRFDTLKEALVDFYEKTKNEKRKA